MADKLEQVAIRLVEQPPLYSEEYMDNPEAAIRVMQDFLAPMERELLCVVNLQKDLRPINMNIVSMGALDHTVMHPREIFKSAILSNAASMLVIHNHPSGSLAPSQADIDATARIQQAGEIVGIPLLDHIIVSREKGYYSMKDTGILSLIEKGEKVNADAVRQEHATYRTEKEEHKTIPLPVAGKDMKSIMESLEEGVKDVFTSERYAEYLKTMSKFHNYSFQNTLLIAMQRPDATFVAGYRNWQSMGRQVRKGEKGITIIAPAPIKRKEQQAALDQNQHPILDKDGKPKMEEVEVVIPRFKTATVFDIEQTYGKPIESENIAIGFDALSNMNLLVIGGSGSYKTTSVLTPNLLRANCTNIILDIKGDLLKKHGRYLKEKGVTVKALNFKSPLESDRYNPFLYIRNDSDLIGLITNIQQSVKPPDAMQGEPFWEDGVGLYLQSMFEHEWLTSKEQGRRPTMNNILKLVNMEARKVDEEGTTELQQEMDSLASIYGDDYPPVRDYRKLKEGATETVRSIIIMVNAQLRLFELPEVKRIFEDDDIDIPSLGLGVNGDPEKKTALFLVMRSGDMSYNLFINLFYTQLFRVLRDVADNECKGGKLPIHVRLWADEYYAGPKPADAEMLLGEIRSRNISMVPILQDISQLKTLYPQEKWEIFTSNCASTIYLGSGPTAHSTHQWISDMLEDMTIDTRSESLGQGMNSSSNLQMSKAGMKLMTPGQIREMPKKDCILFLEGLKPIYDHKALPFHTQPWLESEKLAGEHGYTNPVRVIYNPKDRTYRTIRSEEKIKALTKREFEFYKEAEKTDRSIKTFEVDAEEFLYLNWHELPHPSEEELAAMVRDMAKQDVRNMGIPEDILNGEESVSGSNIELKSERKRSNRRTEHSDQEKWDLSGSIVDCLLRYADQLSDDELEEIIGGMEDGLSDHQIKEYFTLHDAGKMNQYRRMFRGMNQRKNK